MPLQARVYRIFIASPADVSRAREQVVNVIQAWNDQNSADRKVVLLPLRWETHSAPGMGRPQGRINRIVDECDLAIGVFWTKVGTPTGSFDSGTLEEIDRVKSAGKPVMLYFSEEPIPPRSIELDQLSKLIAYKNGLKQQALFEIFTDLNDFGDKLRRQLDIEVRRLMAESGCGEDGDGPSTVIDLQFANPADGSPVGTESECLTKHFQLTNLESVTNAPPSQTLGAASSLTYFGANGELYSNRLDWYVAAELFRPVAFYLTNKGTIGARDVLIDFRVWSESDSVLFSPPCFVSGGKLARRSLFQQLTPVWGSASFSSVLSDAKPVDRIAPTQSSDGWYFSLEVGALQPGREICPNGLLFVGATESCRINFSATVYADMLPKPLDQELTLKVQVEHVTRDARELLDSLNREREPS